MIILFDRILSRLAWQLEKLPVHIATDKNLQPFNVHVNLDNLSFTLLFFHFFYGSVNVS